MNVLWCRSHLVWLVFEGSFLHALVFLWNSKKSHNIQYTFPCIFRKNADSRLFTCRLIVGGDSLGKLVNSSDYLRTYLPTSFRCSSVHRLRACSTFTCWSSIKKTGCVAATKLVWTVVFSRAVRLVQHVQMVGHILLEAKTAKGGSSKPPRTPLASRISEGVVTFA